MMDTSVYAERKPQDIINTLQEELELHPKIGRETKELFSRYETRAHLYDDEEFAAILTLYVAYQHDQHRTYKDVARTLGINVEEFKHTKIQSKKRKPFTTIMENEDLEYPQVWASDILPYYADRVGIEGEVRDYAKQLLEETTILSGAPRTIVAGCLWKTIEHHEVDMSRNELCEQLYVHPSCLDRGVSKFE